MTVRKPMLPNMPLTLTSPSQEPVWLGPMVDGISQTMISRYLSCNERFRVLYVEGLQPVPTFRSQLEFGNLWHAAEEAFAQYASAFSSADDGSSYKWERAVYDYGNKLAEQYPFQRTQVIHWIQCTIGLFSIYIDYWRKHPDMLNRKPLLQEEKFAVDYKLPSGRTVKLRGKWDSIDAVTKEGIVVMENKTKSGIDHAQISRQLKYDLQTMLYTIALQQNPDEEFWQRARDALPGMGRKPPIKTIRYNVIKRGTHKTAESMVKSASKAVADGDAGEWFARWNVEISAQDIERFKRCTLDPVLENILDDYEWWAFCMTNGRDVFGPRPPELCARRRHYIQPYAGYNPLSEGGESDIDSYLFTGNTIGLQRITHNQVFPEL